MKKIKLLTITLLTTSIAFCILSCNSNQEKSKAVEWVPPVSEISLNEKIDSLMVDRGKELYETKCISCHNFKNRMIGPALNGITKRRSPEWIMNMILEPEKMVVNDIDAKKLLEEYNGIPMTSAGLTKEEARDLLEFLRANS